VFTRLRSRLPWDWEQIGCADFGRVSTALDGKLYIATTKNRLWRRFPVGADVVWRDIGHTNNVVALAASGDSLFCVTSDNRLWWRDLSESANIRINALAANANILFRVDDRQSLSSDELGLDRRKQRLDRYSSLQLFSGSRRGRRDAIRGNHAEPALAARSLSPATAVD